MEFLSAQLDPSVLAHLKSGNTDWRSVRSTLGSPEDQKPSDISRLKDFDPQRVNPKVQFPSLETPVFRDAEQRSFDRYNPNSGSETSYGTNNWQRDAFPCFSSNPIGHARPKYQWCIHWSIDIPWPFKNTWFLLSSTLGGKFRLHCLRSGGGKG